MTANHIEHDKQNSPLLQEQGVPRRDEVDFSNILQRAMHPSLVSYLLFRFDVFFGRDNFLYFKKEREMALMCRTDETE